MAIAQEVRLMTGEVTDQSIAKRAVAIVSKKSMQDLSVPPSSAPTDLFDRLRNLNDLRISLVCKIVQAIALAIPS
jgi:hypothetical protein